MFLVVPHKQKIVIVLNQAFRARTPPQCSHGWCCASPVDLLIHLHAVQRSFQQLLGDRFLVAIVGSHLSYHVLECRVVLPDDATAEHWCRLDMERHNLRASDTIRHTMADCKSKVKLPKMWTSSLRWVLTQEAQTGPLGKWSCDGQDTQHCLCRNKNVHKMTLSASACIFCAPTLKTPRCITNLIPWSPRLASCVCVSCLINHIYHLYGKYDWLVCFWTTWENNKRLDCLQTGE